MRAGRGAVAIALLLVVGAVGGCNRDQPSAPPPAAVEEAATAIEPVVEKTLFEEAAGRVGLRFEHYAGATGDYYFPEIMGSGAALFDYDGDGDLDLFLLQGTNLDPAKSVDDALVPPSDAYRPGHRLFRNRLVEEGKLRFADATEAAGLAHRGYGMGAATGDIDNDGDLDLYLTHFGANRLYRNQGDGTFRDITAESGTDDPRWSTSAAFADVDNDGDLDLAVANYVGFTVDHNKRCSAPSGRRDFCGPNAFRPVMDRLYRNDGGGRFTDVTHQTGVATAFGPGLGVIAADFDDDGWMDLYVANDQAANQLWMNREGGAFDEAGLMSGTAYNADGAVEASMGVTAGDYDNDGDEDLFMTHLANETNTLYRNEGGGNFVDATFQVGLAHTSLAMTGFGSTWFDYDNDGLLDLFVANGAVAMTGAGQADSPYPYRQPDQLFHNDGDGRFTDVSDRAGTALRFAAVSRGAAFGDVDNDGDVDVVVCDNSGPVRLLLNQVGNRRHWLSVRLQGTAANRDGVGARVAVLRPERPPLWRRAHSDGSYLSANDIRVHFGLGDDTAVAGVAVVWPGGRREIWREGEADRFLTLTEGSGQPWDGGSAGPRD